jgi:hypothetical protein
LILDIDRAIHRLKDTGRSVDASALAPCDLDEITALDESVDCRLSGGARDADRRFHAGSCHHRRSEELLGQSDHRVRAALVEELVTKLVLELD